MEYRQQGDVLLKSFLGSLKGSPVSGSVLHQGQNHKHRLQGGAFRILDNDGTRFLDVGEDTTLVHPEHAPLAVPAGSYAVEIVKEYDHWLEESRQVLD